MKWHYFLCCNCTKALRTTIDNPDGFIKCVNCGYSLFTAITKTEYDEARRSAPIK